MSEKEIYERNIFLPSQNNICGVITEDNAAYKCSSNKFCNYTMGIKAGMCENTDCYPYTLLSIYTDSSKFDGSDVSRNITPCERKISTDGKCGLDNNSTKCPDGQCCSIKGTCGDDKESCLNIDERYNLPYTGQYISPYYNDISNNRIALINREYFSNKDDVKNNANKFIKQMGDKYIGNNNFEISTNGKCGLDLENEKIFKCPDNQYCGIDAKCSVDYNKYSSYGNNIYLDFPDLSLNLIHGDKFNEDYNKLYDEKKRKIQSIHNKYINNNFDVLTNGICGIDLENEKIFKCSDNQYCTFNNNCSSDYSLYSYDKFGFDYSSLDLSFNAIYLKKKDSSSNLINLKDETTLKDLSSNLMNGDKFNEEFDKWLDNRIKNNYFDYSYSICGKSPQLGHVYKCANEFDCCINNECKNGEICKNVDPNSKFHGDLLFSRQDAARLVSLDCNNSKMLDNYKKDFSDDNKDQELKIVGIIKTNKVDDNTCDLKYNYVGKFSDQENRRIIFKHNSYIGDWEIAEIKPSYSGLTIPLDPEKIDFPATTIAYIVIVGVFILALLIDMFKKKNFK